MPLNELNPTQLRGLTARIALVVGGCLLATGCGAAGTDSPGGTDTPAPTASASASTPAAASTAASAAPSEAASDSPSEGTFTPGAPLAENINVVLGDDGEVFPNGKKIEVVKDTLVTLRVRSTHDDEIHVHGYNVEEKVPQGKTVTVSFKANKSGSFEIESHSPAKTLVILNVR